MKWISLQRVLPLTILLQRKWRKDLSMELPLYAFFSISLHTHIEDQNAEENNFSCCCYALFCFSHLERQHRTCNCNQTMKCLFSVHFLSILTIRWCVCVGDTLKLKKIHYFTVAGQFEILWTLVLCWHWHDKKVVGSL